MCISELRGDLLKSTNLEPVTLDKCDFRAARRVPCDQLLPVGCSHGPRSSGLPEVGPCLGFSSYFLHGSAGQTGQGRRDPYVTLKLGSWSLRVTLSEISQTEKDKYFMLSPICGI